jgi:enamine deaminase RidA (YjgF/YER057c/UK114 family)
MSDISRMNVGTRMSDIVIHNGVVYLSGKVPTNTEAGIAEQTGNVLQTIDKLLARAGTSKERILKAQIFLADISDFNEMNKVWDAWVTPGATPARATVEATLARKEILVEIVIIAAA